MWDFLFMTVFIVMKLDKDTIKYRMSIILDKLVFGPRNIPFKVAYLNEVDLFSVVIDVDLDRINEDLPSFDPEYEDYISKSSEHVLNGLSYIGLREYLNDVEFNYVNEDQTDKMIEDLNQRLSRELEDKYNIRRVELEDNFIEFEKELNYETYPHLSIIMLGQEVYDQENNVILNCADLSDLMNQIYYDAGYRTEVQDFVCV